MQRLIGSPGTLGMRAVTFGIVLLLLASAVVGSAAAAPRLFVSDGALESDTALVGADFDVNVTVKNIGSDGGGKNVAITRNGTKIAERWVVVGADETETFTETMQFEEPGRYVIEAGDEKIGTVTVERATTRVVAEKANRRTVEVRAAAVPTAEPYTFAFPASNQSVVVDSWTVEATQQKFTQRVTTYSDPAESEARLPGNASSSVVGVVTVGSTDGVGATTMRLAVNRSRLRAAGLDASDVSIYRQNGSTWERVATTVAEKRVDAVVYEASVTGAATLAVGRMEPSFSLVDTSFESVDSDAGQRIVLEGVVRNEGSVGGEYDAAMFVNGERINETTISIPAAAERSVRLSHDVTEPATYKIRLNDADAGSLVISESQVGSGPNETAASGDGGQGQDGGTAVAEPDSSADNILPEEVPATVMGIDTLYLGGGVLVALLVFLVVALLLRGSGGGNTGGFNEL
ncbi:PGF-pre-PGF domain-containing protein [Haloarcula amylovorans]|uniref:PGF-pre-PGF domain-containing protein n=1 Tax=Haloarcula amylovorans TaxID=2562280 RepID=UPI001076BCEB|nr:PGF-pre-PGF domain-containing protein [Halomicroarcula amylolytica]